MEEKFQNGERLRHLMAMKEEASGKPLFEEHIGDGASHFVRYVDGRAPDAADVPISRQAHGGAAFFGRQLDAKDPDLDTMDRDGDIGQRDEAPGIHGGHRLNGDDNHFGFDVASHSGRVYLTPWTYQGRRRLGSIGKIDVFSTPFT